MEMHAKTVALVCVHELTDGKPRRSRSSMFLETPNWVDSTRYRTRVVPIVRRHRAHDVDIRTLKWWARSTQFKGACMDMPLYSFIINRVDTGVQQAVIRFDDQYRRTAHKRRHCWSAQGSPVLVPLGYRDSRGHGQRLDTYQ